MSRRVQGAQLGWPGTGKGGPCLAHEPRPLAHLTSDDDDDDACTEEDVDEIGIEGVQEYFGALELGLDDPLVLPLCYYLQAPAMGKFTRAGFVSGWLLLDRADTLDAQKAALARLRDEFAHDKPVRLDAEALAAQAAAAAAQAAAEAAAARNRQPLYYNAYSTSSQQQQKDKEAPKPPPAPKTLYKEAYEFTYGFVRQEGQKSLGELRAKRCMTGSVVPARRSSRSPSPAPPPQISRRRSPSGT